MADGPAMLGKDPQLPPTPSLTEYEFEDFTEALLSAHRYCDNSIVHVRDVERWGRRGDKQDGIDLKGTLSDGTTVAWQCKRQDNLTPGDVRDAVGAVTYNAEKYLLVFSGQASTGQRRDSKAPQLGTAGPAWARTNGQRPPTRATPGAAR